MYRLFSGASLAILALSSAPAWAQTAPVQTAPANGSSATVQAPVGQAPVGEVIVTAQRRSENLQKVPLAVTVATQQVLQDNNINNAQFLDEVIPSLTFKQGTANVNSTLSVRGIGTQSFSSGAEPSVSTVVDGVVYGRAGMAFQEFTDLDHIEVLGGPQGTLFGKNASAGVVNMVTRTPSAVFSGDISAAYYTGDEYRADFYVTGPITDQIRYGLSGVWGDYKGNIYNNFDDKWVDGYRRDGLRGELLDEVSSSLTVALRADFTSDKENCCADVLGNYIQGQAPFPKILVPLIAPINPHFGNDQVDNNLTPGTLDYNVGASVTADYKLGGGYTVTSISAWREWRNKQIRDGDFTATCCEYANGVNYSDADYGALNYNQVSQEFRLTSPSSGRFQYVVGAFFWYTYENDWFNRIVDQCTATKLPADATGYKPCSTAPGVSTFTGETGPATWHTEFYNQALYGQSSYALTDQLKLITGLRFSHDVVKYDLTRTLYVNGAPQPTGVAGPDSGIQPTFAYAERAEKEGISAKGGLEYQLTADNMLYAIYSRGYKGPSMNDYYSENKINSGTIAPETSNAYEVGTKNQFLGHRLTVNADLFWEDFSNFQANTFIQNGATTTVTLGDAGNVRSRGFELNTSWRATEDLTLAGGYTYDDGYIVKYNCTAAEGVASSAPTASNVANVTKCLAHNGEPLPFAPRNKFDVTANYNVPLPSSTPFNLRLNTTYTYSSTINFDLDQGELARQPGYGLWDVSATFSTKDNRFKLAFIGKNVLNQYYTSFITPATTVAPGTLNPPLAGSYSRLQVPRDAQAYAGVKLTANF
jgi:iron complex outermembrane receptor protein